MRKYYVDIFHCKRKHIRQAINEYLQEIQDLGGIVCPSVIFLNGICFNSNFDFPSPNFRIFSIQRGGRVGKNREVRIVINLVCEVKL